MSLYHSKGFGLLSCTADLPHDTSIDAIENAIQTELEEIRVRGVSEDDFTAARNLQLKSMYSEFYDRLGMANEFGRAFAHAKDPLLYPKLIKDLKSVRRDDIPRLIDQYLTNDNSITLSLTLPEKKWSIATVIVGSILIIFPAIIVLFGVIGGIRKLLSKLSQKTNEYVSESDT